MNQLRSWMPAWGVVAIVSIVGGGTGCSSQTLVVPAPASSDAGADPGEPEPKAPPPSTATDGGADARPDAAPANPNGVPLVPGAIGLIGVTSDDDVVYVEATSSGYALKAIPLGGGSATSIGPIGANAGARVDGRVLGIWDPYDASTKSGALKVWTRANGLKSGPVRSSPSYFWASADGSRVAYSVAATNDAVDLGLAETSDPSLPSIMDFPAVNVSSAACGLRGAFLGDGSVGNAFFVVACTSASPSGAALWRVGGAVASMLAPQVAPRVRRWDKRRDLAMFFSPSAPAGGVTCRASASSCLWSRSNGLIDGLALAEDDTLDLEGNPADGYSLVRNAPTTVSPYKPGTWSAPAGQTLGTWIESVAPNRSAAVLGKSYDSANPLFRRASYVVAVLDTSGLYHPLSSGGPSATSAVGFTGSGSRFVYFDDATTATQTTATLTAFDVATQAHVFLARNVRTAVPLATGTAVVFADSYSAQSEQVDLRVVDAASPSPPKLLATRAGEWVVHGTKLVFDAPGGLFVRSIP